MSHDDDDKPTVVLDLNALKKQKLKQEEELVNMANELEFNVRDHLEEPATESEKTATVSKSVTLIKPKSFLVILFDFQSNFFETSLGSFPKGYDYRIAKSLNDLNQFLKSKDFQIVVFNYDVNPKAVNQLSAQIKQKLPLTKTMIMARAVSPEKAKQHARTTSGANGYYQFPLEATKVEKEFQKIHADIKQVS